MSLHIGITADPYLPVPPALYGGIERIIDMLVRGLTARGHEVTLFAHPASTTPASQLVPYGVPPHVGRVPRFRELLQLGRSLVSWRPKLDIVHSFGRLAALAPILPARALPKVQSYQRVVPWRGVARAVQLGGPSIVFTGCSASMFENRPDRGPSGGTWHRIFNGVDVDRYDGVTSVPSNAPLAFLGKLEPMKGVHLAIEIARRAGRRLVIAGNRVAEGPDAPYFDEAIAPHLGNGRVEYVGPVNDAQKNALLGGAAALLFPTLWDEAFGIVMAEAMACGTPVIGWRKGSVPEVIQHGTNGFICASPEEGARAVEALSTIDRRAVRRDCEKRFSSTVIVDQYERLYRSLVS